MDGFDRHWVACNNARLPGERRPFRIGAVQVGWVTAAIAEALRAFPCVSVTDTAAALDAGAAAELHSISHDLAAAGHYRWRGEAFDVRADHGGPVLATLDRGALPSFGTLAHGVHVNGLVRRQDGLRLWVGKRAADKLLDPGKLDHIVAGGVSAGLDAMQTLVKEAAEEAAIPESLARHAVPVSRLEYAMERPEGLRRDRLHCYDLEIPDAFTPRPEDGEIEYFELWPLERAYAAVRDTDQFKFNVNLVLIDLFKRLGMPV